MKQKGFTLIELLVVIAIIGILATIVLASLNTARVKANDVAVKSNLDNARAQAELYYDSTLQTYVGVCAALPSALGISVMIAAANAQGGATSALSNSTAVAGSATQGVCHDNLAGTSGWAAMIPLKSGNPSGVNGWCVDSTGTSKQVLSATGLLANDVTCN